MSKFVKYLQADSPRGFLKSLATVAKSTLHAIMGRMATYTGQEITWDMAWNSKEKLGPTKYEWGPVPIPQVSVPGVTKFV
jgi:hypothetical protein